MTTHSEEVTLLQIAHAAELIAEFIAGFDRDLFGQDSRTQSAVLHQLLIIGEAVKRLSPEFCGQHPGIPWKLIAGMRDKLIHAYDSPVSGPTRTGRLLNLL
jgi:uncharacterized protein with HEPN domain